MLAILLSIVVLLTKQEMYLALLELICASSAVASIFMNNSIT